MSIYEEEYEFKCAIFNCHFPTYAIDFHLQIVFDTIKKITWKLRKYIHRVHIHAN